MERRRETAEARRGPVRGGERALLPDLARGSMLLFIGLANAAGVVLATAPGLAEAPRGLERALSLFLHVGVHARAYPVFAIMFGYGLVQLARRQEEAGDSASAVRSVLLRRNAALVGFGLVHAALLYYGDFLGAYGLVGLVATLAILPRGERVYRFSLWLWAASLVHVLVLAARLFAHTDQGGPAPLPSGAVASLNAPDYLRSVALRLTEWPTHTASVLPFIVIVWLGIWAARRRLLDEPARHRGLLAGAAVLGLGTAIAGGLPFGLLAAGVQTADAAGIEIRFLLHQVSGMFGGPGYVALFGLLASRRARTNAKDGGVWRGAVVALGQRSLSGYLFQSAAWLLLFAPFTLALGRNGSPLTVATAAASGVWLFSLVGAALLQRSGGKGPAEDLLRRLAYGGPRVPAEDRPEVLAPGAN